MNPILRRLAACALCGALLLSLAACGSEVVTPVTPVIEEDVQQTEPVSVPEGDCTFTFSDSGITADGASGGYEIEGCDLSITAAGVYVLTGACAEGTVTVKREVTGVTLVLDGLTLASSTTSPLTCNKSSEVTVQLVGTSKLTDNEDAADDGVSDLFEGAALKVKTGGSLTLTGDGTLAVEGACKNGVKGAEESTVTVDGPTLVINAVNHALGADGTLTVVSGSLTLEAGEDAIHGGNVTLLGGSYAISCGDDAVHADYALVLGTEGADVGPQLTIEACNEGLEGASVDLYSGSCTLTAADDGINAANSDLTSYDFYIAVHGGSWHIDAGGDALDSNGDVRLLGGVIELFGSATAADSALDFEGTCTYGSGTLLAVGMSTMAQTPSEGVFLSFGSGSMGVGSVGGHGGGMGGFGGGGGSRPQQGTTTDGTTQPADGAIRPDDMTRPDGTTLPDGATLPEGMTPPDGTTIPDGMTPPDGATMPEGVTFPGGTEGGALSLSAGASFEIRDADGTVLYTATTSKNANSVVFACKDLTEGASYTLYVDGAAVATATAMAGTGAGGMGMHP